MQRYESARKNQVFQKNQATFINPQVNMEKNFL